MENLRWILIFAGVAILVLLYFSGRSGAGKSAASRVARDSRVRSGGLDFDGAGDADPLLGDESLDTGVGGGFDEFDPRDFDRPGAPAPAGTAGPGRVPRPPRDYGVDEYGMRPLEAELPAALREERTPGLAETAAGAFGGLSQKIESIGARLSPKRRERIEDSEPEEDQDEDPSAGPSKIITLHVAAPEGGHFDGSALLATFERREFVYGEMSIFHSMHRGKTVFSIAKMVKPGIFDPHDIDSFATPGITLILQLPGPVAADTAFEVLLSEAFEMADELGGTVLDGDRSTLSKQTAQHMREGIYEYMHRQKYFGSALS